MKGGYLLIEWSSTHVRVVDPLSGQTVEGSSLTGALGQAFAGREAAVGISRRTAYVKSLHVPNGNRNEVAKILEFQLDQLIPFNPGEYVCDFHLGELASANGRIATLFAIKSEHLRRIYADAEAAGIRLKSVLPVAFGSTISAKKVKMANGAVVFLQEDSLNIDLIHEGELWYSRAVGCPDSTEEIRQTIARTFLVAELSPGPILVQGSHNIGATYQDSQESLAYLGLSPNLPTLELPENRAVANNLALRSRATVAIAAASLAVGIGAFGLIKHRPKSADPVPKSLTASLVKARKQETQDKEQLELLNQGNRILDVAFKPSQTVSDVIFVLANSSTAGAWFTSLSVGRGIPVTINGAAMSEADITAFAKTISDDIRFQEMKVVSTNKAEIGKKPITEFLITGKAMGLLAFDRPPRAMK